MQIFDIIVLVTLFGLIAWMVFYRNRKVNRYKKTSPDIERYMVAIPESDPFKDTASASLDLFFEKYKASFAACDRSDFDAMQKYMDACLENLKEIFERLPNDAYAQRDTKVAMSNIESVLRNHFEDVRKRCSFPAIGMDPAYEFHRVTGMTAFND